MRLVDVNTIKSRAEYYNLVPQPMAIYHSTEEFRANEPNATVVSSFEETLAWLKDNHISLDYRVIVSGERTRNLISHNLWFKTLDKFVPDYADPSGTIFYKTNDKGEFIPTDACYIKVYFLIPLSSKLVFYTSAGVNSINMFKWEVTAAVRTQFQNERDLRKSKDTQWAYQDTLDRLLRRRKGSAGMFQFVYAMFTPASSTFLDLDKSAKLAFGNAIRAKDRYLILQSESFRRAMIQIMKILMPELKKATREKFTPEVMVDMLIKAGDIAVKTEKIDDILKVFKEVKAIGYEEEATIKDDTIPNLPRIGDGEQTGKPKEIMMPQDAAGDTLPPKLDMTPEELKQIKEDLDYPDAFVTLDVAGTEEEPKEKEND